MYFASIEELIKKPPPLRQRPGDVGNFVSNSVITYLVMVCCSYCFSSDMYIVLWLLCFFIKFILFGSAS
jgi:hypothetical protein